MKKIFCCILLSIFYITNSCAMHEFDGVFYPVEKEGLWNLELTKSQDNNFLVPKPYICYLKTNYSGSDGIEVIKDYTMDNTDYTFFLINKQNPAHTTGKDTFFLKKVIGNVHYLHIINYAIQDHNDNKNKIVFVACEYTYNEK